MTRKLILSLCDRTGNWSRPCAEDPAYEVKRVDLVDGHDVRLLRFSPSVHVHGILAAPPCTHLSQAGSPSFSRKGEQAVLEALSVVDACVRLAHAYKPAWWALENPVGRLKHWLGPWTWTFNPADYGGYLLDGEKSVACPLFPVQDAYPKRTCIWGDAKKPSQKPVAVTLPPRPEGHGFRNPCFFRHEEHRSITPLGFARAFKLANP